MLEEGLKSAVAKVGAHLDALVRPSSRGGRCSNW
jgi:hypothetical protein